MNASMIFAVLAIGRALQGTADSPKVPPTAPRTLTATAATGPIRVDGVLNEGDWKSAPVADGFVQSEPNTGAAATERTEVRVLYDANTLYIGAFMHDDDPGRLVVNDIKKDFAEEDQDDFEVILDTFTTAATAMSSSRTSKEHEPTGRWRARGARSTRAGTPSGR